MLRSLLPTGWFVLALACVSPAVAAADSSRTAFIAGYQPDREPLEAESVRGVFDWLRERSGRYPGYISRPIEPDEHRAWISFADRRDSWSFFGQGHWAYPSVVRRRYQRVDGIDRLVTAYRCEAAPAACSRLRAQIAKVPPQHVYVPLDTRLKKGEEISAESVARAYPSKQPPDGDLFFLSPPNAPPRRAELLKTGCEIPRWPTPRTCPAASVLIALPRYPPQLAIDRIDGTTKVVVHVDARGSVVCAEVEQSSGHRALDQAALETGQSMVFRRESCRTGRQVSRVRIPVEFVLPDAKDAAGFQRLKPTTPFPD